MRKDKADPDSPVGRFGIAVKVDSNESCEVTAGKPGIRDLTEPMQKGNGLANHKFLIVIGTCHGACCPSHLGPSLTRELILLPLAPPSAHHAL